MEPKQNLATDYPFNLAPRNNVSTWDSSSIWARPPSNGLAPAAAARESSHPRGEHRQLSAADDAEEAESKTGSASLVDSSVLDEHVASSSAWGLGRNPPPTASTRTLSQTSFAEPSMQHPRSLSNSALTHTLSNSSNAFPFPSAGSRPPTINLNTPSTFNTRQTTNTSFLGNFSSHGTEQQPPNVYTKFDRPGDPSQRKQDSAMASWINSPTTPSPSDERRPQLSTPYTRNASVPASLEGGLLNSIHADDARAPFARPDYSRSPHHATPASSRAPSISSRNGMYGSFLNPAPDSVVSQLGKFSLGGDSRPSTSYKSVGGHSSHPSAVSATSSLTRPSFHTPLSEWNRSDYFGGTDLADADHRRSDSSSSALAATRYTDRNLSVSQRPDHADNYGSDTLSQPFANGNVHPRSQRFHPSRPTSGLQVVSPPRRLQGNNVQQQQQQQQYLDPRMQQMVAAQMQSQFGPWYHPFLGNPSLYMNIGQYGVPGWDTMAGSTAMSSSDPIQSTVLAEFKVNPKSKRDFRDIHGCVTEFAGDQLGSRFVQAKLETANSDEKERVFQEIEPNIIPLMTDIYGNYVIQKFFEHGDQRHKKILANKMRGQVLQLSLQMYGCRVVQKALDHILVDQQAQLVSELDGQVIKCVKDQNGNHVIQKAIERCPPPSIGFIIASFQGHVVNLSTHAYGCRVIQRCLEKCDPPSKASILSELVDSIQYMVTDQFGNYVVQHIVTHDNGEAKQRVLDIVAAGLESYSRHKFASNVVEACLLRADDHWRHQVMYTIAYGRHSMRPHGEGSIVSFIKDNFGNYVIQKLLDTLNADDFQVFRELLRPAVTIAKRNGCGKQVVAIEKKMLRSDRPLQNLPHPMYGQQIFRSAFADPRSANDSNHDAATPPPALTADTHSLQSSRIPSVNGDAIEGAPPCKPSSELSNIDNSPK